MLIQITMILPIIIAGLMNGSFVIPAKYINDLQVEKIWFFHTVIGLILIPWLLHPFISHTLFQNYINLPETTWFIIISSGLVFGLGQICFANAIKKLGVALSFTINLGIGMTIGSFFVILYKVSLFTQKGLLVILAIMLILCSLVLHYLSEKVKQHYESIKYLDKLNYFKGWILASLAGIASGVQNIAFILVTLHENPQIYNDNSYWIWPPFLMAAAIPMLFWFAREIKRSSNINVINQTLRLKNFLLITLMGLFFTGSLAIYSKCMSQMNPQQQILGWPTFMVSIILASQAWGLVFKEKNAKLSKNRPLRFCSLGLLIIAILILAAQA